MKRSIVIAALAFSMAGMCAWAESNDDYTRIARISYMEGHVSFQSTENADWTAAAVNFPLQPGDRIYTGTEGRAEIEFNEGSVIRLAERTDIQFLSLKENLIQIRVLTGLSSLMVSSSLEFEMDTPAAAFIMRRPGSYRFDANENGNTYATVRTGDMDVVSHRFVHRVQPGMQIYVTAGENGAYDITGAGLPDAWDEWNDRRNADRIAYNSRKYIPDNVYAGVSDLDRNGRWVNVESYGMAWIPFSVGVSWSPYSVGRWCYRPTWGWTWVSYESWGWLPFHYGRWYHSSRYGWCWLPGPSFSFNFWSPGLVTFYYGPSWVSWCPLGPGDYYSINNYYYNKRLYGRQLAQLRGLSRRSSGYFMNRHVRGAFQTWDIDRFRNGSSRGIATRKGYIKIDRPWERGEMVRERLAVRPDSRSFSPNPDGRAERSRIAKPRSAVVYSEPSIRAKSRGSFVSVKNSNTTSLLERRSRTGENAAARDRERVSGAGSVRSSRSSQTDGRNSAARRNEGTRAQDRRDQRSYSAGDRESRVGNSRNEQIPQVRRSEAARSGGNSARNNQAENALRSRPQIPSRQYMDGSAAGRSVTERDSLRDGSAGGSRSAGTVNRIRSLPSVSPASSARERPGFTERQNTPTAGVQSRPSGSRESYSGSGSRNSRNALPSVRSSSQSSSPPVGSEATRSSSAPALPSIRSGSRSSSSSVGSRATRSSSTPALPSIRSSSRSSSSSVGSRGNRSSSSSSLPSIRSSSRSSSSSVRSRGNRSSSSSSSSRVRSGSRSSSSSGSGKATRSSSSSSSSKSSSGNKGKSESRKASKR